MEPYPKSKARLLHDNEIPIEYKDPSCVSLLPFLGISPFRYRDIFQKARRKDNVGNALDWAVWTDLISISPQAKLTMAE